MTENHKNFELHDVTIEIDEHMVPLLNKEYSLDIPYVMGIGRIIGRMRCVSILGGQPKPFSGSFVDGLRHDTTWWLK